MTAQCSRCLLDKQKIALTMFFDWANLSKKEHSSKPPMEIYDICVNCLKQIIHTLPNRSTWRTYAQLRMKQDEVWLSEFRQKNIREVQKQC